MRWRLAWLGAVLSGCVLGAQPAIPVTAIWDLDPSHDAPGLTWELERDGTIHPCGNVTVTATERRCTATVPAATGVYRLRGLTAGGEPGPWSVEGTPGTQTAPGQFTILWHGPITLTEPEPGSSTMPTINVVAETSDTGVGSLTTPSFTVGAGSNRAFVAFVTGYQSGITVTGVTVAGVTATSAGTRALNGSAWVHAWYGVAPAAGSQPATATFSDTWGTNLSLRVIVFDDADQTTPITGYTTATGTGTAITLTVADVASTDIVVDTALGGGGGSLTVGADQTQHGTTLNRSATSTQDGGDGGVMSWTGQFSEAWAQAAVRVQAAAGGGGADAEGALIVPASTLAASITVSRSVSAAMTIPAATLTAAAMVDRTVSAAMTAGAMALASSVAIAREVAGALEIAGLDLVANLANDRTVSGALTLPPSTLSAVAARTVAVEGALDVPSPLLAAITDAGRTVNGALTLPPATLSAAVARVVEAEGSLALPVPTLTAAVSVARFASGELALAVPVLAASVETESLTVSGALVLPMPVLDADAMVSRTASGALSLSMPVLDGDVMRAVHVDGVLLLRGLTLEATAMIARMASGDLDAPALVAAATAIIGALQPVMLTRADTVSLVPVRDTLSQVPVRDVLSLMPVRDVEAL